MMCAKTIKQTALASTYGYPLMNLGASTVLNTRRGVHAVVDWETVLIRTRVKALSAAEYRS